MPDGGVILEVTRWTRPPDWGAAAWFLERRYPEEFGRRAARPERRKVEPTERTPPEVVFVYPGDEDGRLPN